MTDKYASEDLYTSFYIREPKEWDELHKLSGLTNHPTEECTRLYYITTNNWITGVERFYLHDPVTGKFFLRGYGSFNDRMNSWFTLDQLLLDAKYSTDGMSIDASYYSPTNQPEDVWDSTNCSKINAVKYFDSYDNTLKYLVQYMPDLRWQSESQLNSSGYYLDEFAKPLCFKSRQGDSTVQLTAVGSPQTNTLEVSNDGITWNSYTIGTVITLQSGQTAYFRGKREYYSLDPYNNYLQFVMSGSIVASGNVNSLLYKTKYITNFAPSDGDFYRLFADCTALKSAPLLPLIQLSEGIYREMFSGCTSLEVAPQLPATTLADDCYMNMFSGCRNLISPPQLPATTLADYCYYGMFSECTSLTRSPDLPATEAAFHCYNNMFNNCSSLKEIHCKLHFDYSYDDYLTEGWVYNVAAAGKFYCDTLGEWPTDDNSFYMGIPIGWTVYIEQPLCFKNTNNGASTVKLKNVVGSSGTALTTNYEYTKNNNYENAVWTRYTVGQQITLQQNEKVYFRGNRSTQSYDSYMQFELTGELRASGNINSLLSASNYVNIDSLNRYGDYTFYKIFSSCQDLYTYPDLPATSLAQYCYAYMFDSCTNIEEIPVLPSVNIPSYAYTGMFEFCTSLNFVNYNALPASTVGTGGYYYMFNGCTYLKEPPELPATQISNYSYSRMFQNCGDLWWAPDLPATTLAYACYEYMFYGCTDIDAAPELPATTLVGFCYARMFYNCGNVDNIICYADTIEQGATSVTLNWLYGVAASGTFNCIDPSIWTVDSPSGIPVGWTVNTMAVQPLCIRFETGSSSDTMTVSLNAVGTYNSYNLQTSTDSVNWSDYTPGTQLTAGRADPIYFRGNRSNHPSDPENNYLQFSIDAGTRPVYVSGNINSLLSNRPSVYSSDLDLENYGSYVFKNLFKDCTNIYSITESYSSQYSSLKLPTKLSAGCFYGMFDGCIGLYHSEYSNTNKLLPSTTLKQNCYNSMFKGCIRVNRIYLPATTPASGCYDNMFNGCTSLDTLYCDINTVASVNNFTFSSVTFTNWLSGVSSSGKLYCTHPAIYTRDSASGIPNGWNPYCVIGQPILIGANDHSARSEYWWMTDCLSEEISQETFKIYEPSYHSHLLETITPSSTMSEADGDSGGYIHYVKMAINNNQLSSEDTEVDIRAYIDNDLPAMEVFLPYGQYTNPDISTIIGAYGYETGLQDTMSGLPNNEYSLTYYGNYTKISWQNNSLFNNLYCYVSKEYDGYLGWDMSDYVTIRSSSTNDTYELYNTYMNYVEIPKQNAESSSTFRITALYDECGNLIPASKYDGTLVIRVVGNVISLLTARTRTEDLNVYKVSFIRVN